MVAGYDNHQALAVALSGIIKEKLAAAIQRDGIASMALSGGQTPIPLLQQLVSEDIDWANVQVTLVDERCVVDTDKRSNAGLLKTHLLSALGTTPVFYPLYLCRGKTESTPLTTAAEDNNRCLHLGEEPCMKDLKFPLDIAILGMGEDGHTASFFPDADNIHDMLDLSNKARLMTTQSVTSIEQRVTWTLASLLQTQWLALHIVGSAKYGVYQRAVATPDLHGWPVSAVIHQQQSPLSVFYAPE